MLFASALMTLGTIGLTSCGGDKDINEPTPVAVSSVTVSPATLTLVEGGATSTLTVTVSPANATDKSVTWSSSNESVATVSGGTVTPKAAGTATVTAKAGGKSATCTVTVESSSAPSTSVTGVSLDRTTLELTVGGSATLTAAVKPDNATNKNVTWKSSNTAVATVENGRVTAVKAGTAKITVTTEDGGRTATCDVTVKTIAVSGLTLDKSSLEMAVGEKVTLNATVKPDDASNKKLSWESSAPLVASVTAEGIVSGIAVGKATITVTTEDGNKSAKCEVTVKGVAVTGITLNVADNISLAVGGTQTIRCTLSPDNAANKNVKWSSSDNSKVKINSQDNTEARIEAVAEGSATITATTEDGSHTAKCVVTVVATEDFKGSGTEDDPYRISTKKDLETLATKVNGGERYEGKYFKLMNNIDLGGSASPWTPIGSEDKSFRGTFDGNSKTISGLYINQPTLEYQALFGYVNYGEIKNLTVTGSVTGGRHCGGIVAQADGLTITGCTSNVTVTGESDFVGGIVGRVDYNFTIKNCTNKGKITGRTDKCFSVGGIIGCASGYYECLITDCSNSGNISGFDSVGGIAGIAGIAGYGSTNVFSCYNSGTISSGSESGFGVGGIVGRAGSGGSTDTYIVSCYNAGAVTAPKGETIGGVVGLSYATVSSCYNAASVSGGRFCTGGIVGSARGWVIASYNRSKVNGQYRVGGVIGELDSYGTANMSYCLNAADGGTDVVVGQCDAGVTVGTDVKALSKAAMTDGTMLNDLNTAVDSYNSTKPTNAPTAIKFKAGTGGWPEF